MLRRKINVCMGDFVNLLLFKSLSEQVLFYLFYLFLKDIRGFNSLVSIL